MSEKRVNATLWRIRCRYRSRTVSIRRRAHIISRGEADNAQIYSKSRADTKRKQKEMGEVPPLTQCTRGACAHLQSRRIYTPRWQAPTIHPPIFFSSWTRIEAIRTRAFLPTARDECEKNDWVYTYARTHACMMYVPYTRHQAIHKHRAKKRWSEKESAGKSEKDGRGKENEIERERKIQNSSETDRDRDGTSEGVESESEKNAKMHAGAKWRAGGGFDEDRASRERVVM